MQPESTAKAEQSSGCAPLHWFGDPVVSAAMVASKTSALYTAQSASLKSDTFPIPDISNRGLCARWQGSAAADPDDRFVLPSLVLLGIAISSS